jgi:hypothetical protein
VHTGLLHQRAAPATAQGAGGMSDRP